MSRSISAPAPAARTVGVGAWLAGAVRWAARLGMTGLFVLTVAVALLAALPALGGGLLVVTSGSMRPAIQPGDAVVVMHTAPEDVRRGEVIAFRGYGRERLTTHRVVGFHDVEGRRHFLTKGDANEERDRDAAPPEGLVGTVELRLPGAGWLLSWTASPAGRVLTLLVPAAVIAALELRDLLRGRGLGRRLRRLRWRIADRLPPRRRGRGAALALVVVGVTTATLVLMPVGSTGAVLTDRAVVVDSSLTTLDVAPPTNPTATFDCGTLGLGKGILLEWDAVAGADGFEIARSTTSGGPYGTTFTQSDGSATSYFDDTVENDRTYYYVVRTVAGGWVSEDSVEVSESTPSSLLCLL